MVRVRLRDIITDTGRIMWGESVLALDLAGERRIAEWRGVGPSD